MIMTSSYQSYLLLSCLSLSSALVVPPLIRQAVGTQLPVSQILEEDAQQLNRAPLVVNGEGLMPTVLMIDVESVISTSSYPWTIESMAASASFFLGENDIILMVVKDDAFNETTLYTETPLPSDVGILFTQDGISQQSSHLGVHYVTYNESVVDRVHPREVFRDLEALGPTETLPFENKSPVQSVQSIVQAEQELEYLRAHLRPSHKSMKKRTFRKSMSRKKRTKLQKQAARLESRKMKRKGYNFSVDSKLFEQRLASACTEQLVVEESDWMAQVVGSMTNKVTSESQREVVKRPIPGYQLSNDVVEVERVSKVSTPLRLLVLSDTHGYEHQFQRFLSSDEDTTWPDADVFIHCGDFCRTRHDSLDALLAQKTSHIRQKYIIRGNHDPIACSFPLSGAEYVTSRKFIELEDGTKVALYPFLRSRSYPDLPPDDPVDILVSHEPPFGLLDRTYRNERVGSLSLRHVVESSNQPPAMWLCGHIHEGRGCVWHSFSGLGAKTAVINAANANSGKAKRIARGPVLIDLMPPKRQVSDSSQ